MAAICHTPIGGAVVRVTRLSTLGAVVTGAGGYAVSSGWTSVTMSDSVDAPDEYRVRAGAAGSCVAVKDQPKLNWADVTVDFARADPEMLHLITGAPNIPDAFGTSVGWAAESGTYATGSFALELWTRLTRGEGVCAETPHYGYLLLPWLVGGVYGGVTHDRGVVSFTVKATTQPGNQWGAGPYNVVLNGAGTAVPLLAPVPAARQRHWQLTQVPLPAATCGALTL